MQNKLLSANALNEESFRKFSVRLKNWRELAGLPLKHVAYEIGVSTSTVGAWEQGSRFPSMQHLLEISNYTGIPVCAFFRLCDDNCKYLPDDENMSGLSC